ncbi:VWA domain-containing protein [Nonlabens mediterrranea]|uniref:VWA domain-containing protein n=1 Tax=Nonlabens mediterrranea TaxID=1419947 RepID=A0ABS0A4G6_9FLAO|nr:VWA domain-containing protein [Nonlabens mediterrranea]
MMKNLKNILLASAIVSFTACNGSVTKKTVHDDAPEIAMINTSPVQPVQPATIQIALLLDTSGSMNGLIDQAKTQLWNLVNQMTYAHCNEVQANIEIALYEYGNTAIPERQDFLRQIVPFSTDLDLISKELFALDTNGGDEYCGAVIKHATQNLEWRNGQQDLKMIFIAGNESFLQGSTSIDQVMGAASQKDITVNTIFCGDAQTGISLKWKNGSKLGHGEYTVINHNQKTHYVTTPYDDQILKLNTQLNSTYVSYGSTGEAKSVQQSYIDHQTAGVSVTANVNRSIVKSKSVYKNAEWDLIDAAEDEEMLEDLIVANKMTLSADLKDKSVEEIKIITLAKKEDRAKIQKSIQELSQKRDFYIKTQNAGENELESAMVNAVKKKAKLKNYSWK